MACCPSLLKYSYPVMKAVFFAPNELLEIIFLSREDHKQVRRQLQASLLPDITFKNLYVIHLGYY